MVECLVLFSCFQNWHRKDSFSFPHTSSWQSNTLGRLSWGRCFLQWIWKYHGQSEILLFFDIVQSVILSFNTWINIIFLDWPWSFPAALSNTNLPGVSWEPPPTLRWQNPCLDLAVCAGSKLRGAAFLLLLWQVVGSQWDLESCLTPWYASSHLPMLFEKGTIKWKLCAGSVGLICSLFMLYGKNHLAAHLCDHRIIVSQNGLEGILELYYLFPTPLLWAETTFTRPGCSAPHGYTVVPWLFPNFKP